MGAGEGYTLHPAAMTMAGERIEDLAADQVNHCVTVWRKPDRTAVLLDPTWVPGVLELWSSREQRQEVLVGLPEGSDLMTTPISAPERHPLDVELTTSLAGDGTIEARMKVSSDGQSDASIRRVYRGRPRNDWPAIDRQWIAALDARAEVRGVSRTEPDPISRPFAIEISFRIPGYARRLDDGSLVLTPLAARHPVGEPRLAVEALLREAGGKNGYDARGVNTGGPCPYLPGNGGLLYAVAMMAAGWDGGPRTSAPGFPDDGSWEVRWEGLRPAP